ncbi:hypothetical protein [Marinobacter mobilis]|uniref:Response regulatory domain-containing protein n=1 Tax=Marinobacter mobilis TaxID=488533 RepID=A0A1H2Y160_9GAMM|nr:hypothetical protein [Marinobacter mobilis]SDW98800.1 hypothetical protein SAMN04487960_105226 [Marinobacter mobilis]
MSSSKSLSDKVIWLAASHDKERRQLVDALSYSGLAHRMRTYDSAEGLLGQLDASNAYPGLILLALSDGEVPGTLDILTRVKQHPVLRVVPVIVFKPADSACDTLECYRRGAASVIRQPLGFQGLVEVMRIMENYWVSVSPLPELRSS